MEFISKSLGNVDNPQFSKQDVICFVNNNYSLIVDEIWQLESYKDLHFLLKDSGKQYTLKIYNLLTKEEYISATNKIHSYLKDKVNIKLPEVILNKYGNEISTIGKENEIYYARLCNFIPGETLTSKKHLINDDLAAELSEIWGSIDYHLLRFKCEALLIKQNDKEFYWEVKKSVDYINERIFIWEHPDIKKRYPQWNLYLEAFKLFKEKVDFSDFLVSITHNDQNNCNVIVEMSKGKLDIVGIIDFDNCEISYPINSLALICNYSFYTSSKIEEKLNIIKSIIKGYSSKIQFNEKETKALYYLIYFRFIVSHTSAIINYFIKNNEYIISHLQPSIFEEFYSIGYDNFNNYIKA